jgi:hypothetical protein
VADLPEPLRNHWACLPDVISKRPWEVMPPVEARDGKGSVFVPSSAPVMGVKRGVKMIPKQKAVQSFSANSIPIPKKTILKSIKAASASLSEKL